MKGYFIFFLVMLTLAEIIFSLLYYFLTLEIDLVLVTGFLIYTGSVITASVQFQKEKEEMEKRRLLESLLN